MPRGEIIPVLNYPDVREAVEWLCRVFGFFERLRIADHRAQLHVGINSSIIVAQGRNIVPAGSSVMLKVGDVDNHYHLAVVNGAEPFGEPETFPYGERQYTVKDPWGHTWTFTQTVKDVLASDWGGQLIEERFWK